MENIGKYLLHTHENEPPMAVRNFKWQADEHNAMLEWTWPTDSKVKLMLVFPLEEKEEPDIANFLWWGHEHTVVSRNLSSNFQAPIEGERQRFMICPAYFDDKNTVVVYKPQHTTDWMYKKQRVEAKAKYKPLRLSRYKQVTLDVKLPISNETTDRALRYGIYENNRLIGVYPLDSEIAAGNHSIYVRKNQEVRFIVDEDYTNRFEID